MPSLHNLMQERTKVARLPGSRIKGPATTSSDTRLDEIHAMEGPRLPDATPPVEQAASPTTRAPGNQDAWADNSFAAVQSAGEPSEGFGSWNSQQPPAAPVDGWVSDQQQQQAQS